MINVQVERNSNENALTLLRRFNKRVQGAGIVRTVRANRYKARNKSILTRKKRALSVLERRLEVQELIKLGKLPDRMGKSR
ncbi:MAG: hypothetical protein A3C06_02395 [Candidatus Taylorbacteria bacterium RIFCSPHIGHO2_02_FULL_46_13]|uniref:30S ribosomal protein S21 n=1 Tax=Candidatus Taylorbacteria bacterium RIFCSPHIGHO2_02_FULL_46_13 TaxID=1802312 RepID=A0A1G2MUD7_9BACT|nr:MAG: hypothetical protein A3C06_02395 [Candidatus Taylorbacteria bacterium RIFCSPHIGHO2_02_FULL_46_13]